MLCFGTLCRKKSILIISTLLVALLLTAFLIRISQQTQDARSLCAALDVNDTEKVAQLLEEGAYANGLTHTFLYLPIAVIIDGNYPTTPLNVACRNGNVDSVRLLLEHGADPNKRVPGGFSSIGEVYAGANGCVRYELIPLLLSYGAKADNTGHGMGKDHAAFLEVTNLLDSPGETPLQSIELIKLMTDDPAHIENAYGTTLLAEACNPEIAGWLIAQGADINAQNNDGYTPLMRAVIRSDIDFVLQLLENGADPTITNDKGETAYVISLQEDESAISELLKLAEQGAVCRTGDGAKPLKKSPKSRKT